MPQRTIKKDNYIRSRRAIRFSIGGWVINNSREREGLAKNNGATAPETFISELPLILWKAEIRPEGERTNFTAEESAAYSRLREIANWTNITSKGAIIAKNIVEKIDSNDSSVWFELGSCYSNLNRFKNAIKSFNKVVELDPNNSTAFYSLGMMYGKLEDPVKGIEFVKKSLEINPENEDAKSALILLNLIKDNLKTKGN